MKIMEAWKNLDKLRTVRPSRHIETYSRLDQLAIEKANRVLRKREAIQNSFLTGTSTEVLYNSIATGTQLNTFTTEANLMGGLPFCIIPAGFFYNVSATSKKLRVKANGRLGSTGSPTFTWTLRLLTSSTWSAAGLAMSSAALTAGTTVTLAPWQLDVDITFRTLGVGPLSTLAIMGEVRGFASLASPFGGSIPPANTAFTVTTYDHSVTNYLFLSAACSASNSLNLIQLEMMTVEGQN